MLPHKVGLLGGQLELSQALVYISELLHRHGGQTPRKTAPEV